MSRLRDRLAQMMYGRNGVDELGKAVLIGSLIMYLIYIFSRMTVFYVIAAAGLVYYIFRAFSKNTGSRIRENRMFLNRVEVVKLNFALRKTHRVFLCKTCGRKIRVPKGKGKIEITCPVCKSKMIRRT